MANLSHLEVNNFRCFDHVEVDGLTNVNLFVGKNSAGKSTLLEAVSSAISMYPLFNWREYNEQDINDFRFVFHCLDIENDIDFHAYFSDGTHQTFHVAAKKYDSLDALHGNKINSIKDLKCDCHIFNKANELMSSFSYLMKWQKVQEQILIEATDKLPDEMFHRAGCYLLSNTIEDDDLKNDYGIVVKRKDDDTLLKEVQLFDDKVKNIRQIGNDICFDVEGIKEYLPINFMGNGFRRFFNIVVSLMSSNNAPACIDEIENGLHYSNLSKLWNALIQFSVRNNIQLFLTTHSLETMESLKNVLEDEAMTEYRDKVKVFKVAKTENKGYQTYGYGFNEFQTALNSLIEMR